MGKAKKSKGKTSVVKIGNKRLNKLSKQGKLRKVPNKRKRQEKLSASSQKAAHKNEERQEVIEEELPLQEDDISFYGTPGQNLSFTSSIRDRFVNTFQIIRIFHKATYNKSGWSNTSRLWKYHARLVRLEHFHSGQVENFYLLVLGQVQMNKVTVNPLTTTLFVPK